MVGMKKEDSQIIQEFLAKNRHSDAYKIGRIDQTEYFAKDGSLDNEQGKLCQEKPEKLTENTPDLRNLITGLWTIQILMNLALVVGIFMIVSKL